MEGSHVSLMGPLFKDKLVLAIWAAAQFVGTSGTLIALGLISAASEVHRLDAFVCPRIDVSV